MIPRIAHFHWEGPPLGWLRMMGLYSFIRLNPRWEVRLHRTPDDILARKLPCHGNEADWTWLRMVHEYGGFALATDTVFVRPMPEPLLDGRLCACTNGAATLYHCCFGAESSNEFIGECLAECEASASHKTGYQAFGYDLFERLTKRHGGVAKMMLDHPGFAGFSDMPREVFTEYTFEQPPDLWSKREVKYGPLAVGITWFGGHQRSRACEADAEKLDAGIVRLAKQVVL